MPPPAVYVLAILGTIAAGVAFHELVYEPHIAPKLEQWAEQFIAQRKARRRQRAGLVAVPVSASSRHEGPSRMARDKRSDSGDEDGDRQSIELERLVAQEVNEWRSQVERSQNGKNGLRHRKTFSSSVIPGSSLDASNPILSYTPMSPTHVLIDSSGPSTPTTESVTGRPASPNPFVSDISSDLRRSTSRSTLRSPVVASGRLPTPDPSTRGPISNLADVPRADPIADLALLSAPSSRPDSPFSSFSETGSPSNFQSFPRSSLSSPFEAARSISDIDVLSASEHDDDEDAFSMHSSAVSDDDFDVRSARADSEASGWASARLHGR